MPESNKGDNVIVGPWPGAGMEGRSRTLYERYQNITDRLTSEIVYLKKLKQEATVDKIEEFASLVDEFEQLLRSANMWWDKLKNKQLTSKDDLYTLESVATHMERQLNSWDLEKPEHKE